MMDLPNYNGETVEVQVPSAPSVGVGLPVLEANSFQSLIIALRTSSHYNTVKMHGS